MNLAQLQKEIQRRHREHLALWQPSDEGETVTAHEAWSGVEDRDVLERARTEALAAVVEADAFADVVAALIAEPKLKLETRIFP